MVRRLHSAARCFVTLLLVSFSLSAGAAISVAIDRPAVDLNESFTLEIHVDHNIEMQPNLEVLDTDFYLGETRQQYRTTAINNEFRRSTIWSIVLMAKRTGTLTIPPITIGNDTSEPLSVEVRAPQVAPPGEADVFITSEVDDSETYVQAQLLYRIKIYVAAQFRQPALREPTFSGAEVLVEQVGEDRRYESVLGEKAYSVIEKVWAVYPQESGSIDISPARFEARVLANGRITGRKVFDSEAHSVTVKPIPAPPPGYPDAAWLPAIDVDISDEWSRETDRLEAGEPVTRRVSLSVLGQIETQIPAVPAPEIDGMNVYADKPDLDRRAEAEGLRGIRRDQYAMIGVRGGPVEVPELVVPWFNVVTDEWQFAKLPGRNIDVRGAPVVATAAAPEPAVAEPDGVDLAAVDDSAAPTLASRVPPSAWRRAAEVLAAVWLLTLFAWWWTARERARPERVPEPPPVYKQQAKFVKAARRAAQAGDAAAVRAALLEWARLEWPQNTPRSIGEIAGRVAAPLADELRALSAASYGTAGREFDADALAAALRGVTPLKTAADTAANDPLPPLMPRAS